MTAFEKRNEKSAHTADHSAAEGFHGHPPGDSAATYFGRSKPLFDSDLLAIADQVMAEHELGSSMSAANIEKFEARGISAHALERDYRNRFEPVRRARVTFLPGSRFEFTHNLRFDDDSTWAYTLLARDVSGSIADIVAVRKGQLASWFGTVAVLGEEQVTGPRLEPLFVHEDIGSWLRDFRRGIVILNKESAARLLDGAGPLVVENARFCAALRQFLTIVPQVRMRGIQRVNP